MNDNSMIYILHAYKPYNICNLAYSKGPLLEKHFTTDKNFSINSFAYIQLLYMYNYSS